MSVRAALARRLPDLAACEALLADLEADLDLALARQQMERFMAAPRVLLAIQRAGATEVYQVELAGVEWIETDPPAADPPCPARIWEEELPNRLVRPLGAALGLGAMLDNIAPRPGRSPGRYPAPAPLPIARLIGDD